MFADNAQDYASIHPIRSYPSNSIAIKAYVRTAIHPLQATFAWASATDLGQGLGAVGADLVTLEVDQRQRLIGLERLRCRD